MLKLFNRNHINIRILNKSVNKNTIKHNIVKTKKTKRKLNKYINNIKTNIKSYHYNNKYNDFNIILNDLRNIKIERANILTHYNFNNKIIPYINEYTQELSKFINSKYNKNKISNAYIKLWEIYETFNLIPKNKTQINMFHIAELPGQFINCTYNYINKLRKGTKYEWHANSLNPYNKTNRKIFGNSLFNDHYGYLKKHKNKWLWGADDTGNLFNSKNILWYNNYIQNMYSNNTNKGIDIVTGDAGIDTTTTTMRDQQLLEFTQCICCLATCTLGSSTIIKTYTPYHANNTDSDLSSGYFINLIYLYFVYFEEVNLFKPLSSRPAAGEFYIIAKGFKGISKQELESLCKVIDTFKLNQCIFKKDSIPKTIILKVIEFLKQMKKLNCDIIARFNNLLICFNDNVNENKIDYMIPSIEKDCNNIYNKLISNSNKSNFNTKYNELKTKHFLKFIKKYNLI
jgi:23S rRNA U2552 (ribose-2'-O)-methylase RlmE/FtsJ